MKRTIGFLVFIVAFCFVLILQSNAQENNVLPHKFLGQTFTPNLPNLTLSSRTTPFRITGKRASLYTAEDWGKVIDSTWGAGQSAADQLNVFDTFWNMIDQQWAGFPNLPLNWDSVRTVYRPQIGSGLSRGRFYALMSRMSLELLEHHTWIYDEKVESIFGTVVPPQSITYLSVNSLQYKSGVPLLRFGTSWLDQLGGPVTPMPDSSALVYRIDPGNPLGLEPGDLVLGYEGMPWKRLYGQLLDYGLPVSRYWSFILSTTGSTPESRTQMALSAVGANWGMFDTIDVLKYNTGDTLHLSTAPLASYTPTVWATDQVPIAGVPMPQGNSTGAPAVSWGVIQGTNIGYVYVWDWSTGTTPQLFHDAVYDLRYNKKVQGLVLDFRMNSGGIPWYANGGLSLLFSFDPTSNFSIAIRNSITNHLSFSFAPPTGWQFTPTTPSFDRPIAVLIGPACLSSGDYNAFRLRFHPMARSFGKPTNGAFVYQPGITGTILDTWSYLIAEGCVYSNVPGEGYLIHKGVQPDEEVWLTRDGVAKGKDDVVERALAWITSLTYAHDVTIDRTYVPPHLDSVLVMTTLTNPLNHSATLSAIVTDTGGIVRDSVLLYNDGMHGDGLAGDSVWGCRMPVPSDKGLFKVSLRTDDITQSSFRKLPNMVGFATAGPLTLDSVGISNFRGLYYSLTPYVRNDDPSFTVRGASVTLQCYDSWVTSILNGVVGLPDLPPGAKGGSTSQVLLYYDHAANPTYFNLKAQISVGGMTYWTDSTRRTVTGVSKQEALPVRYALEQNYPNPFNPATTIRYSLPHKSQVSLTVYNTLGQQVATLVDGSQEAGYHDVRFDGSRLSSGMCFYRLHAGDFIQSKKCLLLK